MGDLLGRLKVVGEDCGLQVRGTHIATRIDVNDGEGFGVLDN